MKPESNGGVNTSICAAKLAPSGGKSKPQARYREKSVSVRVGPCPSFRRPLSSKKKALRARESVPYFHQFAAWRSLINLNSATYSITLMEAALTDQRGK